MRTDEQVYFEEAIMRAPVQSGATAIPWIRNLIVYPATTAQGNGGPPEILMPVTYEALIPIPGGKAGEYEYEKSWFAAKIPYGPSRALTRAGGPGLPPGIQSTYVPALDATLGSITAAVYGKDTPEGEDTLTRANPSFGRSHSIAELLKTGHWKRGQRILVPWNPSDGKTIRDWLDAAAKKYNWVSYKPGWWKDAKYCRMLWMGISVGVIGIIWPVTIALMTGAGLAGRKVKESDYDLSRFGTGKATAAPSMAAKELDEAGRERLAAMNAALTTDLAANATDGSGAAKPAGTAAGAALPAAKPLTAETLAPPTEEQKASKDYAGEFYPVVKPGVKEEPKN
jgi:hypothetical protein